MILTELLRFSMLLALVLCTYLVLARCYRTGFLGCIGLGMVCVFTSMMLQDFERYELLPEIAMVYGGLDLFLIQMVWRVVYHANLRKARLRRVEDIRLFMGAVDAPRVTSFPGK